MRVLSRTENQVADYQRCFVSGSIRLRCEFIPTLGGHSHIALGREWRDTVRERPTWCLRTGTPQIFLLQGVRLLWGVKGAFKSLCGWLLCGFYIWSLDCGTPPGYLFGQDENRSRSHVFSFPCIS